MFPETERDGDRHINKKVAEYEEEATRLARDLKTLANVPDANSERKQRVLRAEQSARTLAEQLKAVRG